MILDEADMMLSVGFDEDVERILEDVPQQRQTMLFSATMPRWIKGLTKYGPLLMKPCLYVCYVHVTFYVYVSVTLCLLRLRKIGQL